QRVMFVAIADAIGILPGHVPQWIVIVVLISRRHWVTGDQGSLAFGKPERQQAGVSVVAAQVLLNVMGQFVGENLAGIVRPASMVRRDGDCPKRCGRQLSVCDPRTQTGNKPFWIGRRGTALINEVLPAHAK